MLRSSLLVCLLSFPLAARAVEKPCYAIDPDQVAIAFNETDFAKTGGDVFGGPVVAMAQPKITIDEDGRCVATIFLKHAETSAPTQDGDGRVGIVHFLVRDTLHLIHSPNGDMPAERVQMMPFGQLL